MTPILSVDELQVKVIWLELAEAFVKRQASIKDSGRLFGPHGGALDRLDGVLFAAVAGYYIWAAYV